MNLHEVSFGVGTRPQRPCLVCLSPVCFVLGETRKSMLGDVLTAGYMSTSQLETILREVLHGPRASCLS